MVVVIENSTNTLAPELDMAHPKLSSGHYNFESVPVAQQQEHI